MSEAPFSEKLRRTGYVHEYAYYVDFYASTDRTLKRWAKLGRDKNDKLPLDDAGEMRSWWGRNMTAKCPDGILAAAVKHTKSVGSEKEGEVEPEKESEKLPPREFEAVGEDEVGIDATLARLREAEVQAHRMLLESMKSRDEGGAKLAQKMWTDLTAQVRATEKDALKDAETRGLLIPKLYAEQRIAEMLVTVERGFRGCYRSMCEVLGVEIDALSEAKWNESVDKLFVNFKETIFA